MMRFISPFLMVSMIMLLGCDGEPVNSPYPDSESEKSILYSSFTLRPKHLDPARSYSSNEALFTGQIYEPVLQYHYLKRPYELTTLTAETLPLVRYYDQQDRELTGEDQQQVAYSVYDITIKKGILFQPHPAFVKTEQGDYLYHQLNNDELAKIRKLADFKQQASRELMAEDYVYQIKRLAHPNTHSPILGLMSEYIVGLGDYGQQLRQDFNAGTVIDLRRSEIEGVRVIDRYRYQIKVKGSYPQLKYWLAMPFFAAVPWEADTFYAQSGLIKKNITLDWFPVGTGPYYLTENDPNRRMVLDKNPNYHAETYPSDGEETDQEQGLLDDAGRLSSIDSIVCKAALL